MNLKKRLAVTFVVMMSLPIVLVLGGGIVLFCTNEEQIAKSTVMNTLWILIFVMIMMTIMLTGWINNGVFYHIRNLCKAMKSISDGDFDYSLDTSETDGEIEELYLAYEDMRLRLKESSEDKLHNEAKNRELISNITHDLKTPITAIKGYAEGIIDGVADTEEKKNKYVKTIYSKSMELDRLLNELTYYSGIDTNRIPYTFHRINIGDFFADCVEEEGMDLENKSIKLIYENLLQPNTRIIADPVQLRKVISNIIGNSVKYMDKQQGEITIRLMDAVDSVRIEIEDNGRGIAAKDLGNVFERFYRTDASRNSAQGGSGIGLSIVKKIIEDHGGYIWATSKEGEGTCMHFVIRKYEE
ncbi:MAG: HAMP domain-containing histidine kinase [Lachnospiraceae bacterium]|nr:HAMP domain-containing histidine kinase [Candidatus Colinaster equi]